MSHSNNAHVGIFADERVQQLKTIMTKVSDSTLSALSQVIKSAAHNDEQRAAAWRAGVGAIREWKEPILLQEVHACRTRYPDVNATFWYSFLQYVKETRKSETRCRFKVTQPPFRQFYHRFLIKLVKSQEVYSADYLTLSTAHKDNLIIGTIRDTLMELSNLFVIPLPLDEDIGQSIVLSPRRTTTGVKRVGPQPISVVPTPATVAPTPAMQAPSVDAAHVAANTPALVQASTSAFRAVVKSNSGMPTAGPNPLTLLEQTVEPIKIDKVQSAAVVPTFAVTEIPRTVQETPVDVVKVMTSTVATVNLVATAPIVAPATVATVPPASAARLPPPSGTRPRPSARILPPATITRVIEPPATATKTDPDVIVSDAPKTVQSVPVSQPTPVPDVRVVDLGGTPAAVVAAPVVAAPVVVAPVVDAPVVVAQYTSQMGYVDSSAPNTRQSMSGIESAALAPPQSFSFFRATNADTVPRQHETEDTYE